MRTNPVRLLIAAAILAEGSSAAFAQQPANDRPAALEEVVVTAQKRDESLQDVPISMQVVSGNTIAKMEISDLSVMAQQLPNVSISPGTVSNNIFIRGVGSGNNGGFEQSVGTFVDGVYHGRSRLSQSLLVDIERVEVLRGPQSIYFGNNSIAGAFSVTTRRPGDTLEGYAKASYETEGDEPAIEAAVGGPLTDTVGFRLVGRYSDLDGYMDNQGTGDKNPQIKNEFVRGWLDWDITENWQTSLKAEYGKQKSKAPYAAQITDCPPNAPFTSGAFCQVALATGTDTQFDYTRASIPGESGKIDGSEFAWNVDGTLSNGIVLACTLAYSEYIYYVGADTSGVPIPVFQYSSPDDYDQTRLDLRLTSP
jgi:outer membrane receptor protein involved in Fe transport